MKVPGPSENHFSFCIKRNRKSCAQFQQPGGAVRAVRHGENE